MRARKRRPACQRAKTRERRLESVPVDKKQPDWSDRLASASSLWCVSHVYPCGINLVLVLETIVARTPSVIGPRCPDPEREPQPVFAANNGTKKGKTKRLPAIGFSGPRICADVQGADDDDDVKRKESPTTSSGFVRPPPFSQSATYLSDVSSSSAPPGHGRLCRTRFLST